MGIVVDDSNCRLRPMGYNGPPPPRKPREVSAERVIERIDSLARINGMRALCIPWHEAFEEHLRRFAVDDELIDPKPSPPPPPPRPRQPHGSGLRVATHPTSSLTYCTDVERR